MKFASAETVIDLIRKSPEGNNTKFLAASHNLWVRFKNYEKSPPMILEDNGKIVSLIYATFNRDKYTNLYEIVTAEGCEGKGYASQIWDEYVDYAVNVQKMERLKISCTPSSVTWHMRNGLVFWAVDPTGSLRSDQPLFKNREEQVMFRNMAVNDPGIAIPPNEKICAQLIRESIESHKFGKKKLETVKQAIANVGKYWLRDALSMNNVERFFE
jgi:hypothetical protein